MTALRARPIAGLRPDPANPRAITAEAAAGLRFSLDRYGDIAGVTYNAAAGELVTGHQRIARLTEAGARTWQIERPVARRGLTPPDGDAVEGLGVIRHPKTGRRFSVRLVRWTARTQREANLVANSQHLAGTFTLDEVARARGVLP